MDTQPTAETGAEAATSIEDALSNTMSSTFDTIMARDDEAETTEGQDTGEQAAEGATEVAETDSATEEGAETTDQDGAQAAGTAEQPLSPPERWSAADKAEFASLSREAQQLVLKREADVERHLQQESQKIADLKRNYEPLERHIGPRREAWALAGYTPDAALEHLFALSDFATRDKPGFIRWFAQQHGVDIGEMNQGSEESRPNPQLTALTQTVEQLKQSEQQRQQQAQEQARASVAAAVAEFAADTKAHPHYADLEADIIALIPGIRQQHAGKSHSEILQIAYDKATWANEGVRSKILANQERLKNLEAANAAKKAKAAAGANVKTSGSASDGKVAKTIDDTMSDTYDRIAARA